MGTIVDLPLEVFELIIAEFLTESIESYSSVTDCVGSGNRMVKNLRLVCRKWADWIYVHHLYREMIFADIDRTAHFIRHITNRPKHLPRAEIKYLRLFCIWTRGPRPFLHDHEDDCESYTCRSPRLWISAQMVEALIELFSDTILKLELLFWNVLSLPERTLEVIGSIKNLHTLQVGHEKCYEECGQADRQTPTSSSFDKGEHYEEFEEQLQKHYQHPGIEQEFENDYIYDDDIFPYHRHHYPDMQVSFQPAYYRSLVDMDQVKSKIDYECLISLIVTNQKLKSLDLRRMKPIHLRKPIKSSLYDHHIPAITHLQVDMKGECISRLIHLSLFLKPTLKFLSLSESTGEDLSSSLLPVFKNLSQTLEGVFIDYGEYLLGDISQLKFPRLRVFITRVWGEPLADLFKTPMFTSAPLEILGVFHRIESYRRLSGKTFSTLERLRKLVVCKKSPNYSLPQSHLDACDENRIQVVYLDGYQAKDVPTLMEL
ncbi:hypothetical protein MJO29_004503 [Puccinia striiformis f. sp. tritici]|uniref:hypothetical protein n=1 Tax=Puccinia striiformis f. sp. tritici TaxID=168172 RepID=UPI002007E1D7|nr:hypothetical protein Pst134EA_007552 [Puccinia striiformis f. sp. tritici]KAH9470287.1 hypothetical protein Pst134EA_007552 [Puccinia striiformis f. sp. tritici]KAI7964076.1 hypothetical protein MJO29_004503 [Puccinia striiformis f. sp. tritici]